MTAVAISAALFFTGCRPDGLTPPEASLARLEPENGVYFGVNLDWGNDTIAAFSSRLGLPPSAAVYFVEFPIPSPAQANLDAFFEQAAGSGAIALLTLEPHGGLGTVTAAEANNLADYLAAKNRRGVRVMVRFGHEMNGSWYPWSQQPESYKRAFRTVAESVHARAPQTAMMWAPNYGGGYPFDGGLYRAPPASDDFKTLDTSGDGKLDMTDDPYSPYYPGDEYVDWVGMSLYHWGNAYPWGENEIPETGVFIDSLTGNYHGLNGNESGLSDFYDLFAVQRGKPLAITETAPLYNPAAGGATELEIKRAWWRQVFSPEVFERFPMLKMVNWFEWRKFEAEISGIVDWAVSNNPAIRLAFIDDFPRSRFIIG